MVASLHGLAGLLMLEGDGPAALAIYRRVLARIEENKGVRTRETVLPLGDTPWDSPHKGPFIHISNQYT